MGWFANDGYRLAAKDAVNALIIVGINSGKDNAPTSSTSPFATQGKLNDVLGTFFTYWENAQADNLHRTFQGNSESLTTLTKAFRNGLMLTAPTPDLSSVTTEVQHIMYSQMVPVAWRLAPGGYRPLIL
jgi:hypothetical protein